MFSFESIVPDGPGPGDIKLTFSTAKARPSIDLLVVSIKTRDCLDKVSHRVEKLRGSCAWPIVSSSFIMIKIQSTR